MISEEKKTELRDRIKKRAAEKKKRKAEVKYTQPRYDEVYFKGVEWLNTL